MEVTRSTDGKKITLTRCMNNSYSGSCVQCAKPVPTGAGSVGLHQPTSSWYTLCAGAPSCTPKVSDAPTKPATASPEELSSAAERVLDLMVARFTELVPELVEDNLAKLSRIAEIKIGEMPKIKIDVAHTALPTIVTAVVAGCSPFLVGPAGSGKTSLAEQVAKVLGRPFYMAARVTSEYKLMGFRDAHGNTVRTQFREAYEHGGVFLFDEVDASDADALTAFNAALANGLGEFPDGLIRRHENFVAIAAGNTFGRGADRQYVGRNQLDAATLDRFQIFEVDYDEQLELDISGNTTWTRRVQAIRAAVAAEGVRHIVSPRASIMGAKLLAAGMEQRAVEEACIWKGLDDNNRSRVEGRLS